MPASLAAGEPGASATRDRIVSAARRLLPAGVDGAPTLGELARDAGVSRATVHRYFRSREDLLREIDLEPEPGSRERALAAGIALLAREGLTRLSMDEVAQRAGISRANLYRLFPGKSALFQELIRVYSPMEVIARTVRELGDRPPDVLMPALARAIARHLEGRTGLVRSLFFEVAGPTREAADVRELEVRGAIGPLVGYIGAQMDAGRLRPMHPLLALQAFAGPILFHLITRSAAESLVGLDVPLEDAAEELARVWLAAMRPTP